MICRVIADLSPGVAVSAGGRDQLGPIERLVRVLAVLENAGERGAALEKLLEAAQYGAAEPDGRRRMLGKDITYLNDAGWDIENVAAAGTDARWVLRTRDIRLRVELTPAQQAELARAARVGGVDDFADYVGVSTEPPEHAHPGSPRRDDGDVHLALCLEATAKRKVVQFVYKGRARTVHPRLVQPGPSGWYLVGWEQAGGIEKYYVISRMTRLVYGPPGSAGPAEETAGRSLDPATWDVDPATDVQVETTPDFAEQVTLAMRPVVSRSDAGDRTVLTVRVTNRAAFRTRLYGLGNRVRVIAPDDVRAEIVDELTTLAGAT